MSFSVFHFPIPLKVFRLAPSPDEEFGEEQPSIKYIKSAQTHGPAPDVYRDTPRNVLKKKFKHNVE